MSAKPTAAAAAAASAAPQNNELIRQRGDDEAKAELENLRAELEIARRRAEEHRKFAEVAARKGLLPVEAASSLVPESQIAFSYRSSMKTSHAMRLIKEHDNGFQEVDKCLACGMLWTDVLKAASEDPKEFYRCDKREEWNAARSAQYGKNKQQQQNSERAQRGFGY